MVINTQSRHASETSATTMMGESMTVGASPNATLVDVINGERVTVSGAAQMSVPVDPLQVRIFVPEADYVEGL